MKEKWHGLLWDPSPLFWLPGMKEIPPKMRLSSGDNTTTVRREDATPGTTLQRHSTLCRHVASVAYCLHFQFVLHEPDFASKHTPICT
jgi:hypothetical protein